MSKGKIAMKAVAAVAAVLAMAGAAQAGFVNGSFESPLGGGAESDPTWVNHNFVVTNQANVPNWLTTSPTGNIEIWRQPGPYGIGFYAVEGERYAELNGDAIGALFQDVTGIPAGVEVGWRLSHRGRTGIDTMSLTITDLGADNLLGGVGANEDQVMFTRLFSTDSTVWVTYQSYSSFVTRGNTMRFEFGAVSTANGNPTTGNLLDAVDFGTHLVVPEPAALLLTGLALAGVAGASARRRKA